MKKSLTIFIIALLLYGLFFVTLTVAANDQPNVISSDVTWTRANSPYTLSSPVTVNSGATLTIEPGVTVNMNSGVYLQVDGTLVARGTHDNNVQINGRNNNPNTE
jgi:inner membrane protein involved in colicin E2 resistance